MLTAAVWGKHWENKSILCRCNNEAVVHIINTGTSKDPTAMGLMRCLYFIAAKFNLLLSATHLAGKANCLADTLSRNNASYFLSNYPQTSPQATLIPKAMTDLLVGTQPDWTSPSWSSKFNSTFKQLCPEIQCATTPWANDTTSISAPVQAIKPSQLQSLHYVSTPASLVSSSLNKRPSNAISPVSASSTSLSPDLIPSSRICPGSNMFGEASSPKKRRKINKQNPVYQ